MRAHEFLQESQGGIYRRGQEVEMGANIQFANKDNQEIQLLGTQLFPDNNQQPYLNSEELEQDYMQYLADVNVAPEDIHVSGVTKNPGAALVTVWYDNANEKHVAYIKLAKSKSEEGKPAPIMWANKDFSKVSGYGAQTKVAQRATLDLKPNRTVPTNQQLDVNSIAKSVAQVVASRQDLDENLRNGLAQLIDHIAKGDKTPIPGLANYIGSLEVDFGEVAAPVSLITGNLAVGSGYALAEKALLAPYNLTWRNLSKIQYPNEGNFNLYDSFIYVTDEIKINISSKDKKGGAAASVKGIVDDIAGNSERYAEVTRKFPKAYRLIQTIANPPPIYWHSGAPDFERQENTKTGAVIPKTRTDNNKKHSTFRQQVSVQGNMGINGPLYLAEFEFGFINRQEAEMILDMIKRGQGVHPDVALKKKAITKNLHDLIKIKGAKNYNDPGYSCGWHLLAALAKKVANHVNSDTTIKIDQFFKAVLERSNMIQVKTGMTTSKPSGDDTIGGAAFSQFTVIYPPIFDGKIELNADTNYMATRAPVSSGLAFKIP